MSRQQLTPVEHNPKLGLDIQIECICDACQRFPDGHSVRICIKRKCPCCTRHSINLPSDFVRDSAFPFEPKEELIARIEDETIVIEKAKHRQ